MSDHDEELEGDEETERRRPVADREHDRSAQDEAPAPGETEGTNLDDDDQADQADQAEAEAEPGAGRRKGRRR